jgi:amidase
MQELCKKSAHELAALIAAREVSSREVVESHLDRIGEVNEKLNAVTVTLAASALAAADDADASEPSGPLHGVPFTIKENIDCAGSATTQGLPGLAEAVPAADEPVVARMKAAGAIPLARTNLPEMGLRISTSNPLRGRTNNPWDETRTAGGSSGGEAAAIASGMSPLGLGNDLGGSLRNPAYCCGITSLKPTTGRIPLATTIPAPDHPISFRLMGVHGALARSVADLRTAYRALAGWHPRDPFSVPAALDGPESAKRAALVTKMPYSTLPPATIEAIHSAGRILQAHGWQVEEVAPPELASVNEMWTRLLALDIGQLAPQLSPLMSQGSLGLLNGLLNRFDPAEKTATEIFLERDRLAKAWSGFFLEYPAVIGPTWADLPFPQDADLDPAGGDDVTLGRLQFITPANLLGLPAAAVPMGVSDGLATGIQVNTERWREDICLEVAGLIENSVGRITPIDPAW